MIYPLGNGRLLVQDFRYSRNANGGLQTDVFYTWIDLSGREQFASCRYQGIFTQDALACDAARIGHKIIMAGVPWKGSQNPTAD